MAQKVKRVKGEGYWGKKTINGIEYFAHRSSEGKWFYAKTLADLRQKVKKVSENPASTHCSKFTTYEYTMNWLKNTKTNKLKQQTYDNYETLIESWITENCSFGRIRTNEITDDKVQGFLDSLVERGYSLGTIRKQWSVLHQCLRYGMAKNEINKFDLSLITPPSEEGVKKKKKVVGFTTAQELDIIYNEGLKEAMNGTMGSQYFYGNNARAIIFMGYTGLRVSEVTALKWGDVSIPNKTITVVATHTLIKDRDKGSGAKVALSTPKRGKSRVVPLSNRALEQIMFFDALAPGHKDDDYVFLSRDLTPMRRRNIATTFERICRNVGLRDLTLHSLRHGFGSILLDKGVEIKIISELLGHADIRTTYNIYIGISDQQKVDAVAKLD